MGWRVEILLPLGRSRFSGFMGPEAVFHVNGYGKKTYQE